MVPMENKKVAILGAGIAGVSAAVYLKRAGLDFSLFEAQAVGGQLLFVEQVDNYVGIPLGVKGRELALTLSNTLKDLDIPVVSEQIDKIIIDGDKVRLDHSGKSDIFDGLIVATGAAFRKLEAPGEGRLGGRGVSYCAICDGFFSVVKMLR